jgi:hypothetical protein
VAKQQESVPTHYPCLVQKDGLRRVHSPGDERPVTYRGPIRRTLARLVGALRA